MQKLPPITDDEWKQVDDFNKFIWNDFLTNSTELSPKTLDAYYSNLRIWFIWVKDNLGNKNQVDIKPLEFKRFQNWMVNRGCSSSDCANKRAAISSLNNYILVYYEEDHPTFRNFINKSIGRPVKAFVHPKEPLTKEEFNNLIIKLTEMEEWQKIAYLKYTLETGCRREESRLLLKSVADLSPTVKEKTVIDENGIEGKRQVLFYTTQLIRCKGKGSVGKQRRMRFSQDTMDAFKKWLEVRGNDDCPFMFVTKYGGKINQVSETTFNGWSNNVFEKIVGRRIHPHLFRESAATQMVVEDGKDIKMAQRLLGHESSETTEIYVIRDDSDDLDELFYE